MRIIFQIAVVLAISTTAFAQQAEQQHGYTLERVVLVMRHGVRPPTKSAKSMASLSDSAWPDDTAWGAAPGELTPHGGLAIKKLGADLREFYADAGLVATRGSIANQTLIWADGADQRTRATAQLLAQGLAQDPDSPIAIAWSDKDIDPVFDGLGSGVCQLDPAAAQQAVLAQGAIDTPASLAALAKLQTVLAPQACEHGAGMCLAGASKLSATATDVKISGPLSTGATVAEVLLLEYENALPADQVGWGRVNRADFEQLLFVHEHTSNLTRRTPYIASRRAYPLVQLILNTLLEKNEANKASSTVPAINESQRLIVLTGHDTNLSNLAGVFGLDWHLADQPDVTAPGTTIAFERWRDNKTGQAILRLRLFYQDMDQVRNLSKIPAHQITLHSETCQGAEQCTLSDAVTAATALLPKDCTK